MSVIEARFAKPHLRSSELLLQRLALALAATAIVACGLGLLAWLVFSIGLVPKAAPRNPFGMNLREIAPSATGLGGLIMAIQAQFYAALTMTVQAMKTEQAAVTSLATVGFLYGIFHAAGPGHGKGVISAYIVASKRSLWRGLSLSLAAALLQAIVAVALVGVLAVVLNATAASINATARAIELVSFAAIAAVGTLLVWMKAGQFAAFIAVAHGQTASAVEEPEFPSPSTFGRIRHWRELAGVVLAAGIRPCSGAIILLVFALSQGLFMVGIIGAFAMAIGTAITTGALAALAVFAKAMLLRLVEGRGVTGALVIGGIELLAAAFVLILGAVLLTGMWAGGLPSVLD